MESYLGGSVSNYLKELSEKSVTPGGGSASALTAALGAALNLMVINYTVKSGSPEELLEAKKKQEKLLEELSSLIDKDCASFKSLMGKLSRGEDAQKEYAQAALAPMEVCRRSVESMRITDYLATSGNKKLATDVGCALHMLRSAFYSAKLNVEVNLKHIKDSSFVEEIEKELKSIKKEVDSKT